MPIVSTAAPVNPARAERNYPYLGCNKYDQCVVLFTAPNSGFVVNAGQKKYKIGYLVHTWLECNFNLYDDMVTLRNE